MNKERDLCTFSRRVETRYISLSGKMVLNETIKENLAMIVRKINKNLDLLVQSLMIKIPERQIPFVKVNLAERVSNNQLRVIFADKNEDLDEELPEYVNLNDITHLIKMRFTPGHRQVILSQEAAAINAEMLIGEEYIVCAATDIFLDIAMFNSFSFLRELPKIDKKAFSSLKYNYYQENRFTCYYHYKDMLKTEPTYFSFAFAVRSGKTELDLDAYIYLWNAFLKETFANQQDQVEMITNQLRYYKSFAQITRTEAMHQRIIQRFDQTGAKLLLRINKKPKSKEKRADISNYFGIPKFHLGAIKIVELDQYHNPRLSGYLKNGYVSAFKVVVTDYNIHRDSTGILI